MSQFQYPVWIYRGPSAGTVVQMGKDAAWKAETEGWGQITQNRGAGDLRQARIDDFAPAVAFAMGRDMAPAPSQAEYLTRQVKPRVRNSRR